MKGRQGVDWDFVSVREAARRTSHDHRWCARRLRRSALVCEPVFIRCLGERIRTRVLVLFRRRRWYLAIRTSDKRWHGKTDRGLGRVIFEYSPEAAR